MAGASLHRAASLPFPTTSGQRSSKRVRTFSEFNEGNDPYGEHDFGVVDLAAYSTEVGHRVFWKIDYYDAEGLYGSEDPANPDVTTRVLTIFFADEY